MDDAPPPLLVWCLAGFHVALLVALLVGGLYLSGEAGDLLAGLETVVGLALYGYLWVATWWTNRQWLATEGLAMADGSLDPRVVIPGAMKWGGTTGLLFLVPLLAVAAASLVVGGGLGALPFVLLAGVVGALFAFTLGSVVGGLFAGLDLLALRASQTVLADAPERAPRRPPADTD